MALKRRGPADIARDAAIEAFGDAADVTEGPKLENPSATPASQTKKKPVGPLHLPSAEGKTGPTTMLLRFKDDMELMDLLDQVAALEGRKKHPMALRALRIGLEQVRDSYE